MTELDDLSLEKLSGGSSQWGISPDYAKEISPDYAKEIIMSCLLDKEHNDHKDDDADELEVKQNSTSGAVAEQHSSSSVSKTTASEMMPPDSVYRETCTNASPNGFYSTSAEIGGDDHFFCDDILDDITDVIGADVVVPDVDLKQSPDPSRSEARKLKNTGIVESLTKSTACTGTQQQREELFPSDDGVPSSINIEHINNTDIVGASFLEAVSSMSLEEQISGHCSKEVIEAGAINVVSTTCQNKNLVKSDVETDGPEENGTNRLENPQPNQRQNIDGAMRTREQSVASSSPTLDFYEAQDSPQQPEICQIGRDVEVDTGLDNGHVGARHRKQGDTITARSPQGVGRPKTKPREKVALCKILPKTMSANNMAAQHILSTIQLASANSQLHQQVGQGVPAPNPVPSTAGYTTFNKSAAMHESIKQEWNYQNCPNSQTPHAQRQTLIDPQTGVQYVVFEKNGQPIKAAPLGASTSVVKPAPAQVNPEKSVHDYTLNQLPGQAYYNPSNNIDMVSSNLQFVPSSNVHVSPSTRETQQQHKDASSETQVPYLHNGMPNPMRSQRIQHLLHLCQSAHSTSPAQPLDGSFNLTANSQSSQDCGNLNASATQLPNNIRRTVELTPPSYTNNVPSAMSPSHSSGGRSKGSINIKLPSEKRHDRVKAWVNETTYFKRDLDSGIWDPNDCSLRQELPVRESSKAAAAAPPNNSKRLAGMKRSTDSGSQNVLYQTQKIPGKGSEDARFKNQVPTSNDVRKSKLNASADSNRPRNETRHDARLAEAKAKAMDKVGRWQQFGIPNAELVQDFHNFPQHTQVQDDNNMKQGEQLTQASDNKILSFFDADKEIEKHIKFQREKSLENKQCFNSGQSGNSASSLEKLLVANKLIPPTHIPTQDQTQRGNRETSGSGEAVMPNASKNTTKIGQHPHDDFQNPLLSKFLNDQKFLTSSHNQVQNFLEDSKPEATVDIGKYMTKSDIESLEKKQQFGGQSSWNKYLFNEQESFGVDKSLEQQEGYQHQRNSSTGKAMENKVSANGLMLEQQSGQVSPSGIHQEEGPHFLSLHNSSSNNGHPMNMNPRNSPYQGNNTTVHTQLDRQTADYSLVKSGPTVYQEQPKSMMRNFDPSDTHKFYANGALNAIPSPIATNSTAGPGASLIAGTGHLSPPTPDFSFFDDIDMKSNSSSFEDPKYKDLKLPGFEIPNQTVQPLKPSHNGDTPAEFFSANIPTTSMTPVFKKPSDMPNRLAPVSHQQSPAASQNSTQFSCASMNSIGGDSDVSMRSGSHLSSGPHNACPESMSLGSWSQALQSPNTAHGSPQGGAEIEMANTTTSRQMVSSPYASSCSNLQTHTSSAMSPQTPQDYAKYPSIPADDSIALQLISNMASPPLAYSSNILSGDTTLHQQALSATGNGHASPRSQATKKIHSNNFFTCDVSHSPSYSPTSSVFSENNPAHPSTMQHRNFTTSSQNTHACVPLVTGSQTKASVPNSVSMQSGMRNCGAVSSRPNSTSSNTSSNHTNILTNNPRHHFSHNSSTLQSSNVQMLCQNASQDVKSNSLRPTLNSQINYSVPSMYITNSLKQRSFPVTGDLPTRKDTDDVQEISDDDDDDEKDFDSRDEDFSSISSVFTPDQEDGETCLHLLCEMGKEKFRWPASHKGFQQALDLKSSSQETALFVAVKEERVDVVRFLVSHGADVNICCLSLAKRYRSEKVLQTAIHEAVEKGNKSILNALLEAPNVDIDCPRPNCGLTPLMLALDIHRVDRFNNRQDIIELLLDQDASLLGQDNIQGKTPLMYAIQTGDVDLVGRLLGHAGPILARKLVSARTKKDLTSLHFAAQLRRITTDKKKELLKNLIMAGGDASARNAEGETPRDWAKEEITQVLKSLVKP